MNRYRTTRTGWMLLALLLPALLGTATAQEAAPDSLKALAAAVAQSPKDGDAWLRLGHACLDAGNLDRAEKAFRKAMRCGRKAEGENGLGLVFLKREGGAQEALVHFRKARGAKRGFVEAQMNIARTYIRLENLNAEQALKRAIEMDSTYAPAYLMLAEWYLDREYHDRMAEAFVRYLALCPDDADGHYGLAVSYTEQQRYELALEVADLNSGKAVSRRKMFQLEE